MKRFLVLFVIALQSLLWSAEASAAACTSTSLSSYIGLGASGCTIGSLSFTNFQLRSPQAGAVTSTGITVTPLIVGTTIVGVRFGVAPTSSGGLFYDDLITYRVSGIAANLVGATVDFSGSSTTGDAAVSVLEQLCLGGTFGADGVSGCSTGNTATLAVVDVGFGADPAYSQSFAAVASAGIATDIAYDSGSGFLPGSSSTLASAVNLFTFVGTRAVPEPTDTLLLAIGALALMRASRKRLVRSTVRP